jgi:hypothetical protein
MDTFLLIGSLAVLLVVLWKWATPKTQSLSSIKPTTPVVPEVSIVVTEMAVTDGDVVEPTVKKARKPRKKAMAKPVAKKVVKKPRKPKTS